MAKAEVAVKEASSWPEYNLITNNCESFATYLKTGVAIWKQALDDLNRAVPEVAAVAGGSSVALAGSFGSFGKKIWMKLTATADLTKKDTVFLVK